MNVLAAHLRHHGSDDVIQFGYASTREDIGTHARSLDCVVRRLDGVHEVDIVAYSLGCLVARCWLGDLEAETLQVVATPRPKVRRCVMLGPPNQGAERATIWARSSIARPLFDLILGESGIQLGPQFREIQNRLATPACEFGIIAGGRGTPDGWNVEIPGDDDGTVGVRETMLAGAHDFTVTPVRHIDLISDERALRMTTMFLRHGYFESATNRVSIPRPVQVAPAD
jgi:pimeloyl-ACP methyl ester carboxylesterase